MKKKRSRKKRNLQNKAAMLGISGVVCMLLVMLLVKGNNLQDRIQSNEERKTKVQQELEQEEVRVNEIKELQAKMQSDEYMEKIAKEKIGLVKENEILFKEK